MQVGRPGQLEQEILDNVWLTIPASSEIIFNTPVEDRWLAASKSIGIDIWQFAPGSRPRMKEIGNRSLMGFDFGTAVFGSPPGRKLPGTASPLNLIESQRWYS